MTDTVSSVTILATASFIVVGLLRFLVWFARTSNGDYQSLSKVLDSERKKTLDALSDRDAWKLKAMRYSDERNNAIKYAKHWRAKFQALELKATPIPPAPLTSLVPDVQPPNRTAATLVVTEKTSAEISGVMKFELDNLSIGLEDTDL